MNLISRRRITVFALLFYVTLASAEIKVVVEHNDAASATPAFSFKTVPSPSRNDAASKAEFAIVDGTPDPNSAELDALHDGRLPTGEDEPDENFFFNAGTDGGRLLVDLHEAIHVSQVNTYSWHSNSRGPQVYTLYASDGRGAGFDPRPRNGTNPEKCGWKLVARVDTRLKHGSAGGQYAVSISDSNGEIGAYRYLLFAIARTEDRDPFGNTFFSELDVIDRNTQTPPEPVAVQTPGGRTFSSGDGKYQITIDPTRAPDLAEWAFHDLAPVVVEWYPKIIALLPDKDSPPPRNVTIDFSKSNMGYVAITRGNHITCTSGWFRENRQGEAKGCVVHELVHVVQHYAPGQPTPGWLLEGIPDYLRWYLYEPQAHGADISAERVASVRFDIGYRPTANFLNWVSTKYDKDLVFQLNTALRKGTYNEGIWQERTSHRLEDLGAQWKARLTSESKKSAE